MRNRSIPKSSIIICILGLFIISTSLSFGAMTLAGYLNGKLLGSGVSPNDRVGTIMLTTDHCDITWSDVVVRGATPFTETWNYQTEFPDNWILVAGKPHYYSFEGTSPRTLHVNPENDFTRIVYSPGARNGKGGQLARFVPPYELIAKVQASGVNSTRYRLRIGMGDTSTDPVESLTCYQIAVQEDYVGIRDRQFNVLYGKGYRFPLGQATLRLLVRNPVPVRFTNFNQDIIESISSTGSYITVEDLSVNSDASTIQSFPVTITTVSGDNERIMLEETWKNSGIFMNKKSIAISQGAPIPGNGIIEGTNNELVTVTYRRETATAKLSF
ncbi:MAG: hypothetical protein ACE14V_11230 [bacterium]